MRVLVQNKTVLLEPAMQLGLGGEGAVFKVGTRAVKIFHKPTPERIAKLQAMLHKPVQMGAAKGTVPLGVVPDTNGQPVGFEMDLIEAGYADLEELMDYQKRGLSQITNRQVSKLFLELAASLKLIHGSGYIVGDFNANNEQFRGTTPLWCDIDSWQFGKFPCAAGKKQFLTPRLYGVQLADKPVFEALDDWYSYWVLLFKSLLWVHPYGGTHKSAQSIFSRAQQHIMVTAPDVIYPSVGASPDIISDDLMHEFEAVFAKGQIKELPDKVLIQYSQDLFECPNCATLYPKSRKACPKCAAANRQPKIESGKVLIQELLRVEGQIIYSKQVGEHLYVIGLHQGQATLYDWTEARLTRTTKFNYATDSQYDVFNGELVTIRDGAASWGNQVAPVSRFRKRYMVRASDTHLVAILADQLMAYGTQTQLIRSIARDQTWFAARPYGLALCGFFQVYTQSMWWLYMNNKSYDLRLTPLPDGAVQTNVFVRLDHSSAIIKREIDWNGVTQVYTDVATADGKVTSYSASTDPLPHGAVYAHSVLLFPTDAGIVQEFHDSRKSFPQTQGVVTARDTLYTHGTGLLAVKTDRVLSIRL